MGSTGAVLVDVPALAEMLAISERHVRRLVLERRVPYLKIGGRVRFDKATIEAWLAECVVPAVCRRG